MVAKQPIEHNQYVAATGMWWWRRMGFYPHPHPTSHTTQDVHPLQWYGRIAAHAGMVAGMFSSDGIRRPLLRSRMAC